MQNIVDLLLQAFDPKVMATFNGVAKDNKPYLKSNKKFTAANYLEDYFILIMMKNGYIRKSSRVYNICKYYEWRCKNRQS